MNMTCKQPHVISGVVTPPKDLQPAIDALGPMGSAYLKALAAGGKITPLLLAQAADFERGELKSQT